MKESIEITYRRIIEVVNLVDCGKLTSEQGIKKIMKAITKQINKEYKEKTKDAEH
jgi:hypothetical protein